MRLLVLVEGTFRMHIMAKKKSDRHLSGRITLRLPDHESELLRQLSERNERTMTTEVLRALRRHFVAEGLMPDPDARQK
jgi:hypothetical protein